jgi:catechol 2,3-dioxygenase-like lactoylglutathione lyase family enzyme
MKKKTLGPVDHLQIMVSDIQKSEKFYGAILDRLGFTKILRVKNMVQWSKRGTRIILVQSPERFLTRGFHRKRIGLNHIALRASSKAEVDKIYREYLLRKKTPILYGGPREWPEYEPGYYAVYFEDPDRIKLELVYTP